MKTKAYERHSCKSVVSPFAENDHKVEFQDTITNLNGEQKQEQEQ